MRAPKTRLEWQPKKSYQKNHFGVWAWEGRAKHHLPAPFNMDLKIRFRILKYEEDEYEVKLLSKDLPMKDRKFTSFEDAQRYVERYWERLIEEVGKSTDKVFKEVFYNR